MCVTTKVIDMRQIKFRGLRTDGGGYVFGDLTHDSGHSFINDKRVFSTGVAQLLGYDDNGDEIYEGDTLVDKAGAKYYAELAVVCYNKFDAQAVIHSPSDKPIGFTLEGSLNNEAD